MSDEIYSLSATCSIVLHVPPKQEMKSKREKEKGDRREQYLSDIVVGGSPFFSFIHYPLPLTHAYLLLIISSAFLFPHSSIVYYLNSCIKVSLCICLCLLPVNAYTLNLLSCCTGKHSQHNHGYCNIQEQQ